MKDFNIWKYVYRNSPRGLRIWMIGGFLMGIAFFMLMMGALLRVVLFGFK